MAPVTLYPARTLVFEELTSIIGAKGSTAGISIPKSEAVVLSAAEIMEALKRKYDPDENFMV